MSVDGILKWRRYSSDFFRTKAAGVETTLRSFDISRFGSLNAVLVGCPVPDQEEDTFLSFDTIEYPIAAGSVGPSRRQAADGGPPRTVPAPTRAIQVSKHAPRLPTALPSTNRALSGPGRGMVEPGRSRYIADTATHVGLSRHSHV